MAKKSLFLSKHKQTKLKTILLKLLSFIILLFSVGLGYAQNQKNVILLDNWTDTTIEKGLDDAVFNDVWGFTFNGENYCAMGSSIGTHIFKVGETKLELIDFEPGRYQSRYVEHRDYKVYQNYLYGVCDEGESSLQIFDLSYLPDSVHKVIDHDAFFNVCHNIFIDTVNAKLYACAANELGMLVLDISNPLGPIVDYFMTEPSYVHDCYVRNDTAYLNAGFEGLHIYNFAGDVPVELGILNFYPNQGYNHSGWLSPDGSKYAFIDETEGTKIKLCETDELALISISETFATSDYESFVPHNVILLDNLAFISYYNEGFRIFDISKAPIKEIGVYDTFLEDTKYKLNGAWGVYVFEEQNQILVSDRQSGLFLFSFPIQVLNAENEGTYVTNAPLLDANSILIPRDNLGSENVTFTIAAADGRIVYDQANFLNYVNIPLTLAAGTYIYAIYDEFGDFVEGGKFVKAN
jgi:choice-of-anchor B domain-containing protein